MTNSELIDKAEEELKSFRETEVDYGHPNSDVDAGNMYFHAARLAEVIRDLIAALPKWNSMDVVPDDVDREIILGYGKSGCYCGSYRMAMHSPHKPHKWCYIPEGETL